MNAKEILSIIALVLLCPLVLYLREQTYRHVHGNSTIRQDLESLSEKLRKSISKRKQHKDKK